MQHQHQRSPSFTFKILNPKKFIVLVMVRLGILKCQMQKIVEFNPESAQHKIQYRDNTTNRWVLVWPKFARKEVQAVLDVETAQPENVTLRSLNDPLLDLEIDEIRDIVADGNKYGRFVPIDPANESSAGCRYGIVHQVKQGSYVFFVIFGTPKKIGRYLRIDLAVPQKYKKQVIPCILGWKLVGDDVIRDDDPKYVPAKIVLSA